MQNESRGGIFFDFDGVLGDTVHIGMQILARIALQKNTPILTREFIRNHETKDIIKELNVHWWEIPLYTYRMRKWSIEMDPCAKLHAWSKEFLEIAINRFDQTWIVSSNSKERIIKSLTAAKIDLSKVHVYANVGMFHKDRLLKKIIRNEHLDLNKLIYVGDETRDIIAAKNAGMHFLGVSWGMQSPELLKSVNNHMILQNPSEFKAAIDSILS